MTPSFPLRRLLAFLIDEALIVALTALATMLLWHLMRLPHATASAPAILAALVALPISALVQAPAMCRRGRHHGQSLGKQLMGLRVQRDQDAPVTVLFVLRREYIFKVLIPGLLVAFPPVGYGAIVVWCWRALTPRGRMIQDVLLGTAVQPAR